MYNFSQEQIFIFFLIIGLIIGFLFDIFRVIRKVFKVPDSITIFQDIIFVTLSGILIINSIIKLNNGEVRFFLFIGICLGISMYSLTIGKICVIILYEFVKICKKIILFPFFCYKRIFKIRKKQK